MIEQISIQLLTVMDIEPTPEAKAKARDAIYTSMRDVLNTAHRMRQAQKRYFAGEKSLLQVCQAFEQNFDKQLNTLIDEKKQPSLF